MKPIDRRGFLKSSVVGVAAASLPLYRGSAAESPVSSSSASGIIDTNINLFNWPFRALKYRDTRALVAKLKKHRVIEAWAGSFEALFAKDMNGVNERLANECRAQGAGFLVPFGSVNLAWPDWEEDIRRCHEVHHMPGIRIYPGYQPFDLDHPGMVRLLEMIAERGLLLQVVFGMEDPRVHHPIVSVGKVTFAPFVKAVQGIRNVKVQLLHFPGSNVGDDWSQFTAEANTFLDISRLEGNGAVARMIGTIEGLPSSRTPVERILFGSHAPFFPVETAILKLVESPLDASQLQAIMRGNARQLLVPA